MTFGSLFAGIGGLDLGLERAGMTCRWQVEIDPFCQKVLAKHWPEVARFKDVCAVGAHNLERVDVICGGFPCQDVSLAGKGAGIAAETRSGLWFEFARIIHEMQPAYALIENVEALRFRNGGLGIVLRDLAEIGYDAEWSVLRAADLGAIQPRSRLFIVAYPASLGRKRLVKTADSCSPGQGRESRATDLQQILDCPYGNGRSWPQPLLRRMDGLLPGRMDRLKALGNAIDPVVAEWLGRRLMEAAS
jgi:DNA (cytosine-5)-methyltransferase 1